GVKDGTGMEYSHWLGRSVLNALRPDVARLGTAARGPGAGEREADTRPAVDVQPQPTSPGLPGSRTTQDQQSKPPGAQPDQADDDEAVRVRHTIIEWDFESEQRDGTSWPTGGVAVRYRCS